MKEKFDKNQKGDSGRVYQFDEAWEKMFEKSITVPDGVVHIESGAFRWFRDTEEIILPEGLKTIGDECFEYSSDLIKINLPDTLESIGERAFFACKFLKSVRLPLGLREIGSEAFSKCGVEEISLPATAENFSRSFKGCENLKKVTVAQGVEEIGYSAFCGCVSLEEVVLPDGLRKIGGFAFEGCKSLKTVTLPETVTEIGEKAFYGCENLESLVLPQGLKKLGKNALKGCDKLPPRAIPDRLKPKAPVKKPPVSIEVAATPELFTLTGESLDRMVTGVGNEKARYKTLMVPDGVRVVDSGAFYGLNVRNVVLSDGVEVIQKNAFRDCVNFKRIFLPKSVKIIGDDAFSGCKRLEIYCEGEPQKGWLDGPETRKVYYEDMTEAFNFHRSAGSFDTCYVKERVEVTHNNYNPEKRPVHTNVSREAFMKLLETE